MRPELIFFLLVALLGFTCIFCGLYCLWLAHSSRKWPSIQGKIVASVLEISQGKYGQNEHAFLAYEYTVGAVGYVRTRVNAGLDWTLDARARSRDFPIDAD